MPEKTCSKCGAGLAPGEVREHQGQALCEDCYLEAVSPLQPCDPWAVHTAKSLKDKEGKHLLTPEQQRLYELVQERGEVPMPEACAALGLTEEDLRREFAVLRHMELLRARKRGRLIHLALF
jgi:hypothetical protein